MGPIRLSGDMQRVVRGQGLGFVAAVRPGGTRAVSGEGTASVWDDEHLVFLHLNSRHTVANLRVNPPVGVNVVDPIRRKGYLFAGIAEILTSRIRYNDILAWFGRERGTVYRSWAKAEVNARWRQRYLGPGSQRQVTAAWPGIHPDQRPPVPVPAGARLTKIRTVVSPPCSSSEPPRAAVPDRLRVIPRAAGYVMRLRHCGR